MYLWTNKPKYQVFFFFFFFLLKSLIYNYAYLFETNIIQVRVTLQLILR